MKTTKIDTTCGIYEAETTIRDYGHKVCVTSPFIKWTDNTGILAFEKATFTEESDMAAMRKFANAESLYSDDGDRLANYLDD